ncbi:MAG: garK [Defluviitaleaceae bacterium]|jgi:glycerate kinase|nr:garK [Defluviitaleaceae bacterium]
MVENMRGVYMKVVVAIDSFKGSLTSMEAGFAIKQGIRSVSENIEVIVKPLADGGEGTVEALVAGMNGREEKIEVTGPLSEKLVCSYGILDDSKTAIIEMSGAAGITLVPEHLKNPMNTTTYGVGEVIKAAIKEGCRNFIIGIGGSATNDGGVGMLQALGFEFLDENRMPVGRGGKVLGDIRYINTENHLSELDECHFKIACDVTNPLYGVNGAAYVYGPQKGADPKMVEILDQGLMNYAKVVKEQLGKDVDKVPGAGAAGGLGYGFLAFLNAKLESGIQIVLEETHLEKDIKDADLVITGEGKLDFQTAMGKAPTGVAKLAKKYGKKVIAFAGCITEGAKKCNEEGIDAYFTIVPGPVSLSEAMNKDNAKKNMIATVEQVFRLVNSIR